MLSGFACQFELASGVCVVRCAVRKEGFPIRTSLVIGLMMSGALALVVMDDVAPSKEPSTLLASIQSVGESSAEKNARALRDVEAGAYRGLRDLTDVLAISRAQARTLTSRGIDVSAAKRVATKIIEFNNAINLAGFHSFDAYQAALNAPGGETMRHPAVELARPRMASLQANDLQNLDLTLRHLFRAHDFAPVEVASFSQATYTD